MIDENIFTTEVRIPEEFSALLDVSITQDKLKNVIGFIFDTLKRHENAVRFVVEKQKKELGVLNAFHQEANEKFREIEENYKENCEVLKELQGNLVVRHDTADTLKFLLNLSTSNDSLLSSQTEKTEEILKERDLLKTRMEELEGKVQEILGKINAEIAAKDKRVSISNFADRRSSKINIFPMKNLETSESPTFPLNDILPPSINLQKIESEKFSPNHSQKRAEVQKFAQTLEKHYKQEINPQKPSVFEEKNYTNKIKVYEGIFPFPNKNYTETERSSPIPIDTSSDLKSVKNTIVLPSQIKFIEGRLDLIEKILATGEPSFVHNRFNYFEDILKVIEPDVSRNKQSIRILGKKIGSLEKDLLKKLNSEHFDAVKDLVFAMASGIPLLKMPKVDLLPSKDLNLLENLEKRLVSVEKNYSNNKVSSLQVDELQFKLHLVEKKLDFKVESAELEKIKSAISQISEQNKFISSEIDSKEKNYNLSGLKPSDASLITSINRKFLTFEELFKSLKMPQGVTLTNLFEEIQKVWEAVRFILNSLEAYSSQYDLKISEILEKSSDVALEKLIKKVENNVRDQIKVLTENSEKKFADKFEMLRGFKYVEVELKKIEKLATKKEGEDAMLARKPLGGWSCGSCEKNLEKLVTKTMHTPWNKLPIREIKEKGHKYGNSKLISTTPLEPIRKKKIYFQDEMNLPEVLLTDRSVTPQP